jgi:pimeloyl-ACP methyl ester carboxylesterase
MRIACVSAVAALVALALLVAAPGAGAQTGALAFGPCKKSQAQVHRRQLQCATLRVPLDRSHPASGSIALAVQRVPASGPRAGAIVLLAGGPGQAAIPPFEELIAPLSQVPALRGYELVTFDQRGTGESEELRCDFSRIAEGLAGFVEQCGLALGSSRPDYTSQDSVEDLDALREGLGGGPLSLLAVSYGGRVAGMYAHEHPQDVAREVLDSPSSLGGEPPLDTQRLRALPRVLDQSICSAGACRSFTSNAYADLTRLAAKLRKRPLRARFIAERGKAEHVTLTEPDLLALVERLDLPGGFRRLFPAAVKAADRGHPAALARLAAGFDQGGGGGGVSEALFLATYCVENPLPWSPSSQPGERHAALKAYLAGVAPASTAPFTVGTTVEGSAIQVCLHWPSTTAAPEAPSGISSAPTLILSGEDDVRTPLEQSLSIATGYSNVQVLKIPNTGHSTVSTDVSGCAARAMITFLSGGQPPSVCAPPPGPTALPLPPASLAAVRPARSSDRLAGRAAAAAALTIGELLEPPGVAGGGLKGGSWKLHEANLVLRRMVDVDGVSVSGTISGLLGSPHGHVVLGGRVHGTLRLAGFTLTGRLDGARVSASVTRP